MPAGNFKVVRYVPDPARDEPINVGVIASGPAGAVFTFDSKGWARIRGADIHVDPATLEHAKQYFLNLVSRDILQLRPDGIHEIKPWQDGFLDAVAEQFPEHFTAGRSQFIDYADEQLETMEAAAAELAQRLASPPPRRISFPERDEGAPLERLKRRLKDQIEGETVRWREAIQGWTRRVREPDVYYKRKDGTPVVVNVVKLDQQVWHALSRAADANAFILEDLKRGRDAYIVALVEWPAVPSDEFFDALLSIQAVADEVVDAREATDTIADRILADVGAVSPA